MKMFFSLLLIIGGLIASLWVLGGNITAENTQIKSLVTTLAATPGNNVKGVIRFTKDPEGIKVEAYVDNLTPGPHGFHIHQFGNLTAADGKKIGKHLGEGHGHASEGSANSEGSETDEGSKGMTRPDGRPIGDMEMLKPDPTGYAQMEMVIKGLTLNDIVGRSVAIHEHEDRLENGKWTAGPKIALGVIGIEK